MITADQARLAIRNRKQFHKAMIAAGYYVPGESSSFCTVKLMTEVREGKCFCPMLKDMTFLPCVSPPTTSYLVDYIANMLENNDQYQSEEQANQYKRLAKHLRRNHPDKQWLLGVLSTLHPGNEIFKKGYRPPQERALRANQ